MKIVIITGSARPDSNTSRMAASFEGAAYIKALATGKQVNIQKIDATSLNIGPCHGCDTCFSTGKPCSFDDDFNKIAADLISADGIIFAAPVYWWSFPATVKALIDKCYSLYVGLETKFTGKKVALLSCCESPDEHTFDAIKFAFEESMKIMDAEIVGEILVPNVVAQGDIKSTVGIDHSANLVNKFI